MPKIADTITYRHACNCRRANTRLTEEQEHRFDVDGQPFPWHISEDGARFTRLLDDLYRVDLEILPVLRATPTNNKLAATGGKLYRDARAKEEAVKEVFRDCRDGPLVIAGVEFPWAITSEGITYTRSRTTMATIKLAFFAETVDTDGDVIDERDIDQIILSATGDNEVQR